MRVLVARCSIGYSGRLTTRLASGDRIIIFKDDGSVCVHGPKGFKPINYMSGPTAITEEDGLITVRRPETGEVLMIEVEQVIADDAHGLEDNAVLEREGRELELHALLERAPDLIDRYTKDATEVVANSPAEFKTFIQSEARRWAKVVKDSGMRAD